MRHITLAAVLAALCASHAMAAERAIVAMVPRESAADIPAGLMVRCLRDPLRDTQAQTCPVIRYQGLTTWIFAYQDNRQSLALVTYDGARVVRNVEFRDMGHVSDAVSSPRTQSVVITGRNDGVRPRTITVPWSQFGR